MGWHIGNDLVLVAALGIDGNGDKHPLGLVEGATENTAVLQALIDNLIEHGLDPTVCRLFIIDGAKALSKDIRRTFGGHTPIQRAEQHLSLINSRILQGAVVIAEGRADAAVTYMREGLGIGQRSNTAPFI